MHTRFIRGITVHNSYGMTEPIKSLDDDHAFELIFHPSGVLSYDWEGLQVCN